MVDARTIDVHPTAAPELIGVDESPAVVGFAAELTGIATDDPQAAQWIVHVVLSLVPFYDPVRLAEDMSVLDQISAGRASYVFGIGYRAKEFEHFRLSLADRGRLADEKLGLLRRLLADDEVVHDGRRITVTPRPHTAGGPAMMSGGASLAAARRAARIGNGEMLNPSPLCGGLPSQLAWPYLHRAADAVASAAARR